MTRDASDSRANNRVLTTIGNFCRNYLCVFVFCSGAEQIVVGRQQTTREITAQWATSDVRRAARVNWAAEVAVPHRKFHNERLIGQNGSESHLDRDFCVVLGTFLFSPARQQLKWSAGV